MWKRNNSKRPSFREATAVAWEQKRGGWMKNKTRFSNVSVLGEWLQQVESHSHILVHILSAKRETSQFLQTACLNSGCICIKVFLNITAVSIQINLWMVTLGFTIWLWESYRLYGSTSIYAWWLWESYRLTVQIPLTIGGSSGMSKTSPGGGQEPCQ